MYYNYQPYGEMVLPTSFTKITWWSKLISQWATRECFILHCIVQPQTIFCKPRRISVPQDCQDHLLGIFLCLRRAKTFHQISITSSYNFLCAFMINKELWHFIHNNMTTNGSGITIQNTEFFNENVTNNETHASNIIVNQNHTKLLVKNNKISC